jgi:hypothetical protein
MGGERKERPPLWERFAIEAKLRRRLEAARAKHKRAVEKLHRLHDRPDRLRIAKAKQARRNAIDAYRAALKRLNDFIQGGTRA